MPLVFKAIKVHMQVMVGQINEKRLRPLVDALAKEGFKSRLAFNVPGIGFRNEKANETVLVFPEQLTVSQEGLEVHADFCRLEELAKTSLRHLNLEYQVNSAGFDMIAHVPFAERNMLTESQRLVAPCATLKVPGVEGVGLRFFLTIDGVLSEFRVEPLLRNPENLFLQLLHDWPSPILVSDVVSKARELHSLFTEKLGPVAVGFVDKGESDNGHGH